MSELGDLPYCCWLGMKSRLLEMIFCHMYCCARDDFLCQSWGICYIIAAGWAATDSACICSSMLTNKAPKLTAYMCKTTSGLVIWTWRNVLDPVCLGL